MPKVSRHHPKMGSGEPISTALVMGQMWKARGTGDPQPDEDTSYLEDNFLLFGCNPSNCIQLTEKTCLEWWATSELDRVRIEPCFPLEELPDLWHSMAILVRFDLRVVQFLTILPRNLTTTTSTFGVWQMVSRKMCSFPTHSSTLRVYSFVLRFVSPILSP